MLLVVVAIVTCPTPNLVITTLQEHSTQMFDNLQWLNTKKQFFENSMTIKQQQRTAQLATYPHISMHIAFLMYAMCVM